MSLQVATLKGVVPSGGGMAVFVGNAQKTFVIHCDRGVGESLLLAMEGKRKVRPQCHDLMEDLLSSFGGRVSRVLIASVVEKVFHARVVVEVEDEVLGKKVVELDARSSDALVLAQKWDADIFVAAEVWEEVEDVSDFYEKFQADHPQEEEG